LDLPTELDGNIIYEGPIEHPRFGEVEAVEALLRARKSLVEAGAYDAADELRVRLQDSHGVTVVDEGSREDRYTRWRFRS